MDGVEGDDSQSPFASSRTSPRQHRRRLPQQPGDDIEKTPSTQMGMSGRPRPRHMHYWQHPSMRDQNYNSDEFYPIIVESLAHQYPPRQQQPTYNQQVLVFEDVQADVPSQEFPMTIRSLMHSQQEQAEDTRLPPLYSDDVMTYPLHSHVKALENRNKHEHPPDKVNDVQNPLVDSGRVVITSQINKVLLSLPFSERAQHCPFTGKAVCQTEARLPLKQGGFCEPTATAHQPTVSTTISYRRPLQQSENQPFDEEYATSRANQLTERDFSGSFALPPTYTNQKQSETTHQSEPISHQRYPQEDIHHFTQPSFYKPQSSTSYFLPMSSNSHQVALNAHITGSADAVHNWLEVANTREEGSDGEKAGERAEKVAADFQSLVDYYDDLDIINQLWKNSDILSNKMVSKTATTAAGQLSITVTVNSDATCRTITLSVDSAFTETSETLTLTKMDSWPCQAAPLSGTIGTDEVETIASSIFAPCSAANGGALSFSYREWSGAVPGPQRTHSLTTDLFAATNVNVCG
ncbi:hypothetical protein BLNAU_9649 [Blattamonas nauphoetae]|uniref:Uncharacterized protein n=1 Tax=Blattamonas nauphoetae TaxID=2049346 RepID=A0ABQ9XVA8_9EUKA|nr:hypothetical protein BLNAU_9649 [Blattamonas nauphoetae]